MIANHTTSTMPSIKKRQTTLFCVIFGALFLLWSENSTQSQLRLRVQTYSTTTQTHHRQVQGTDESNNTLVVPSSSTTSTSTSDDDKPTMHTFFEPASLGYCCGMMNDDHDRLVHAWEKSWQDRGWNTKVLTKDDAMKHPDFESQSIMLSGLNLSEYNQKCYWRWMAMASLFDENDPTSGGGGFMSDYDTVPLELDAEMGRELQIANGGKFTSYKNHVPCLVHASRAEWDRVLHLLISVIPEGMHPDASDMIILHKLRYMEDTDIVWKDTIVSRFPYVKNDEGEVVIDCEQCENKMAVHLSHHATEIAYFGKTHPTIDMTHGIIGGRAETALRVMEDYREQCEQKEVPTATDH